MGTPSKGHPMFNPNAAKNALTDLKNKELER